MTFPMRKKRNTRTFPATDGKFESTAFKSFDSLLRILPRGTLSKNSLRDEKRRLLNIYLCIYADILTLEKANINARVKAKHP